MKRNIDLHLAPNQQIFLEDDPAPCPPCSCSRRPTIYLAGPISGLSREAAIGWRNLVAKDLLPEFNCLSPMRDDGTLHPFHTSAGIINRDLGDVLRSDLLLINFLGATQVSIGTVMEIAWGHLLRKPMVMAIRLDQIDDPHEHGFITQAVPFHAPNLEEAADMVRTILQS